MPVPLAFLILLTLGIPVAYVLFGAMVIFGGFFVSSTSPVWCCFVVGLAAFMAVGVLLYEVGLRRGDGVSVQDLNLRVAMTTSTAPLIF